MSKRAPKKEPKMSLDGPEMSEGGQLETVDACARSRTYFGGQKWANFWTSGRICLKQGAGNIRRRPLSTPALVCASASGWKIRKRGAGTVRWRRVKCQGEHLKRAKNVTEEPEMSGIDTWNVMFLVFLGPIHVLGNPQASRPSPPLNPPNKVLRNYMIKYTQIILKLSKGWC